MIATQKRQKTATQVAAGQGTPTTMSEGRWSAVLVLAADSHHALPLIEAEPKLIVLDEDRSCHCVVLPGAAPRC